MWVGSGRLERVYPRGQRTNNHEQDGVFLFAMVPRMRDLGTVRPPSASECLSSAMSFAANIYSIATYACIYRERKIGSYIYIYIYRERDMCANCGLATAETCPPKQELRPRGARPVNSSIYIYICVILIAELFARSPDLQ